MQDDFGPPTERRSCYLLLVEDNPALARVISAVAEAEGFKVHTCVDAPQAIEALECRQPAAAIIDCMVAEGSGLDLLGRLADYNKAIPTLIVTGYGSSLLKLAEDIAQRVGLVNLKAQQKPFAISALREFLIGARNEYKEDES